MKQMGWIGNYSYFRARTSPRKEAIYDLDNDVRYTFADLDERADILANYLVDSLKLAKGDRIAFLSRNRIELFDACYAAGKTGGVLVPYNARLSVDELAQLVNSEQPVVLFYEDVFAVAVAGLKQKTQIKKYIVLSGAGAEISDLHYEEIMIGGDSSPRCCPDLCFDDTYLSSTPAGRRACPRAG